MYFYLEHMDNFIPKLTEHNLAYHNALLRKITPELITYEQSLQ